MEFMAELGFRGALNLEGYLSGGHPLVAVAAIPFYGEGGLAVMTGAAGEPLLHLGHGGSRIGTGLEYAAVAGDELIFTPFLATGFMKRAMPHLGFDTGLEARKFPFRDRTSHTIEISEKITLPDIKEIVYKVDVNTLERFPDGKELRMNEIGRVQLRTTKPLYYDSYRRNRTTGSIILIEEGTFNTVGVGMIV